MKENFYLKMHLTLQSFTPLFLLIFVQHIRCDFLRAVSRFFEILEPDVDSFGHNLMDALAAVKSYKFLGDFIVSVLCALWIIGAVAIWIGFRNFQTVNFESYGEKIEVSEDAPEGGASYFVTFVLPLMIENVNTLRGFIVFSLLLFILILLICRSNLFYQNPVLTILKYQVFHFTFSNPHHDINIGGKTYIGITRGVAVNSDTVIKRKYIAGNVFLIFRERGR